MRNRASSYSIDKTWELFSQALNPPTKEEAPVETKMEVEEEKPSQESTKTFPKGTKFIIIRNILLSLTILKFSYNTF